MHLLVSVGTAIEAAAALDGGADIVDAKDPRSGALGAVPIAVFKTLHAVVGGIRPLSAAIGDARDEAAIEATAFAFASAGAAFVKVGFAGITSGARAAALAGAARRGLGAAADGRSALVLVAYADGDGGAGVSRSVLVDLAARTGATGVLLDTADKRGPGLPALIDQPQLSAWVAHVHACGLLAALAGKLTEADLPLVRDTGADVAGVRGAACEGGRMGHVSAERVRGLRACIGAGAGASAERATLA
jgi:(5-formylfuran-3-yl)methyl phosphate synthase